MRLLESQKVSMLTMDLRHHQTHERTLFLKSFHDWLLEWESSRPLPQHIDFMSFIIRFNIIFVMRTGFVMAQ